MLAVGDEADGYDEIIYPCDYLRSGIISDDEMYDILVKELPAGVQLTALVDACHSGEFVEKNTRQFRSMPVALMHLFFYCDLKVPCWICHMCITETISQRSKR